MSMTSRNKSSKRISTTVEKLEGYIFDTNDLMTNARFFSAHSLNLYAQGTTFSKIIELPTSIFNMKGRVLHHIIFCCISYSARLNQG